ncbi:MAG: hypothetical protein KBC69_02265 [Candidatus Magasanikbacteria bacterium]|nr:hypothetical protein [Candidatus Magasanikbacteria bacterium]
MTDSEKKKILQRLWMRASTGLYFIKSDYLARHETPDILWIRNIYILLSFYTELFLKAIYIINTDFESLNILDQKLRGLGHNLDKIGIEIKKARTNFGIKNVVLKNKEYWIEFNAGSFYVKDFNDIRYDFLDDKVRTLNGNEHRMFSEQIEIMLKIINGEMKPLVWGLEES